MFRIVCVCEAIKNNTLNMVIIGLNVGTFVNVYELNKNK